MNVRTLALVTLSLAPVVTGCKAPALDPGYLAAHETLAESQCCIANAYAAATPTSGSIADAMNAGADSCTASSGGNEGLSKLTEKALPAGYDSEYDYIDKLSDADQAKIEAIQARGNACSTQAAQTWSTKTTGG